MANELRRLGELDEAAALARRAAESSPTAFGNPAPLGAYTLAGILAEAGDPVGAEAARAEARLPTPGSHSPPASTTSTPSRRRSTPTATTPAPSASSAAGCSTPAAPSTGSPRWSARSTPDTEDPVVWRNAAVGLVNAGGDPIEADRRYATPLALSPADPRLVYERDQLSALRGVSAADRLAAIDSAGRTCSCATTWPSSSPACSSTSVGRTTRWSSSTAARFQPFEGGEGRVIARYDRASQAVARELLPLDPGAAADLLRRGIRLPSTSARGGIRRTWSPNATCCSATHRRRSATRRRPSPRGASLATAADPSPPWRTRVDARDYWVGVAHLRLGETAAAETVWAALDARAAELETAADPVDYFATSLPELLLFPVDSAERRAAQAQALRATRGRRSGRCRGGAGMTERYLGTAAAESGPDRGLTGEVPEHLPRRLAISLWDFSWYTRAGAGEPFEDLDRADVRGRRPRLQRGADLRRTAPRRGRPRPRRARRRPARRGTRPCAHGRVLRHANPLVRHARRLPHRRAEPAVRVARAPPGAMAWS